MNCFGHEKFGLCNVFVQCPRTQGCLASANLANAASRQIFARISGGQEKGWIILDDVHDAGPGDGSDIAAHQPL